MTLANANVFKIYISHPIFPICVELGTDPSSKCRDYNTLRPPASGAWTILRIFLPAAPLSGFLSPEYTTFKLYGRASRPLCADFPPGGQRFSVTARLLRKHPASDDRWRQRESFNAVENRCEQPPRHSHFRPLERHIFRVTRYLRPDLDEFLS